MKKILSLILLTITMLPMRGNPNWKMHVTFDEEVTRVIDTGDFVYFLGRCEPYNPTFKTISTEKFSLFRYDKGADELMPLSTDNILSFNNVERVEYSPEKGMMVIVYTNSDIDLLYDNGKIVNIPAYKLENLSTGKSVKSIFIDAARDRVYLTTEFGYLALDDKKGVVAESRVYNTTVAGMSRMGDDLLLLTADRLLSAPVTASRFSLNDYTKVADLKGAFALTYLSEERSIVCDASGGPHVVWMVKGPEKELSRLFGGHVYNIEPNPEGVMFATGDLLRQVNKDGSRVDIARERDDYYLPSGTKDFKEIWMATKRKGLKSMRYDEKGERKFTLTRDWMRPDAPAPYRATCMAVHPEYGLLVVNHGYDWNFGDGEVPSPILLSGYKNGFWSHYSPVYTDPDFKERLRNPNGLCFDPENPEIFYFGSPLNGLIRINVEDPSQTIHLSRPNDPGKDLPGYYNIVPEMTKEGSWSGSCVFSAPEIDADGNLWTTHSNLDDQSPAQIHIFCWEAADRKGSTPDNYRPMKMLKVEGPRASTRQHLKPMKVGKNRNLLVFAPTVFSGEITIIDTNGTPTDQSDDRKVTVKSFVDQDGNEFGVRYVACMYEDPLTGNLWIGHGEGVFWFNPRNMMEGNQRVNRVKVARNDGTNLADYLLNLVAVNSIAVDGAGRKWFATSGAGVVCTSSDGRTIEEELTTDNSPLPDNIVYGLGYVASSNSMLISTDKGIAEYFLRNGAGTAAMDDVKAYPNPVRPDYMGYVTIDGLPDGAIVKVTDASGHLVKDLGAAYGGEVKWDVTDLGYKRVGSGVYYIMSSTDNDSGNLSAVGKVMVIN